MNGELNEERKKNIKVEEKLKMTTKEERIADNLTENKMISEMEIHKSKSHYSKTQPQLKEDNVFLNESPLSKCLCYIVST